MTRKAVVEDRRVVLDGYFHVEEVKVSFQLLNGAMDFGRQSRAPLETRRLDAINHGFGRNVPGEFPEAECLRDAEAVRGTAQALFELVDILAVPDLEAVQRARRGAREDGVHENHFGLAGPGVQQRKRVPRKALRRRVEHPQRIGARRTRAVISTIGVAATQYQHFHSSCVTRTLRKCVAHEMQGS